MNLANILENSARFFPDNAAVIEDDKIYTYREFNNYANRIASTLSEYGVRPGDYIGFCSPNSYEWLSLYFGILKCGAVAVTFDHLLTRDEFKKILLDFHDRQQVSGSGLL
jgi:long-chain acyl-CoA synthetase